MCDRGIKACQAHPPTGARSRDGCDGGLYGRGRLHIDVEGEVGERRECIIEACDRATIVHTDRAQTRPRGFGYRAWVAARDSRKRRVVEGQRHVVTARAYVGFHDVRPVRAGGCKGLKCIFSTFRRETAVGYRAGKRSRKVSTHWRAHDPYPSSSSESSSSSSVPRERCRV